MLALMFRRQSAAPVLQTYHLVIDDQVLEFKGEPLQKASDLAGSRWITLHPHGKDEKGVPVLIQETGNGSGVYHVVGGAGGKLN